MKKRYQLVFLFFFLFPFSLLAQNIITGKVTNSKDGSPLAGVTVTAGSGTDQKISATNDAGNFSINASINATEIVFSSVGFSDVVEKINKRSVINIRMSVAANDLNEVVVIGYGTQKKTTLTGAVSTLKGSEMTVTKNENTLNMLTGKVPGLRITQKSAEPGGYDNTFDVRGYGAPPLIVIDGVPRDGFFQMDPNEIESISILKDAAAAVYGVRASNGVVLVTTKKGSSKDGGFDISYSVNQSWQQFLSMPDVVGAVDYMMLSNEAKKRKNFNDNFFSQRATLSSYDYDFMLPYLNGTKKGVNWVDAVFNKTSPQIQHNINIIGGTDKINAFVDLGYMKQDGVFQSNTMDYSRWNFRSNVNIKVSSRLKAQALLSGYMDTKNSPTGAQYDLFKQAWNQVPVAPIYANDNPDYLSVTSPNNPVAISDANKVGYLKNSKKNIQAQGNLEYDIPGIKGLKARALYNFGYNIEDDANYLKSYNLYNFDTVSGKYIASTVNAIPNLTRNYYTSTSTLSQLSLNYANTFSKAHNVGAMILYEESHSKSDAFYASRNMLFQMDYLFGGDPLGQVGTTAPNAIGESARRSVVGRLTYDYKGKYLAEFTGRQDASNLFAPGHRTGFFPAYLVGWRISEEPFFKDHIPSKLISNLKIRASYGVLGYDGGTAFQYLGGYIYPTVDAANNGVTVGTMFNGSLVNGAVTRGLSNDLLTWYTSHTKNIGVDFTVLKTIEGSFDLFERDQYGLPAKRNAQLPGTAGISLPDENLNSDESYGWELSLTHKNRIGDLGYMVSGNISYARQLNKSVIQGNFGNEYDAWRNGQTDRYKNIWWGVDYGGQFTTYNQIYNYGINTGGGNNNVVPGDYYMQDWNGDGVINGDDYHPIATVDLPLINFGVTLGLNYKGIDLTALFTGATGVWTQYGEQLAQPLMYNAGHDYGNALAKFLDSWHTADPYANVFDPNTQWIQGKYPAMGYDYGLINNSTKAVLNASYVRLKTLEIGYTIPKNILKKTGIKNCRVYINSYNLATVTGLEGVDPEHPGVIPSGDFNYGSLGYRYPLNRTFNIGAGITF